jgi:Flp pilus assembly protein TadD
LGQAQIRAQRLDQAKATYRQLAEAHPSYALGWFRLGQLLDNAQDWAGAEASYRTAIAADPLGLDARKALAGMLIERKRLQEAIVVLEEARQVDPNDPIIKRDLERLWAASKRR